jgi:hypothetical protein
MFYEYITENCLTSTVMETDCIALWNHITNYFYFPRKHQSLGQYSSLADSDHGVFVLFVLESISINSTIGFQNSLENREYGCKDPLC